MNMRMNMRVIMRRGFAVVLTLAVVACRDHTATKIVKHNALADSADQVMFGSVANITDHGVLKGQIRSDTGYFFDDNTRLEGRIVQVTFFTETGVKNGVLTSRAGTYNERSGNMDARDDVVVVGVDGRRLTTPRLMFNQNTNQISSDSVFTLTDTTGRYMHGIGFTSDPDMNNMKCLHACSGTAGSVNLTQTPTGASTPGTPATTAPGTSPAPTTTNVPPSPRGAKTPPPPRKTVTLP